MFRHVLMLYFQILLLVWTEKSGIILWVKLFFICGVFSKTKGIFHFTEPLKELNILVILQNKSWRKISLLLNLKNF